MRIEKVEMKTFEVRMYCNCGGASQHGKGSEILRWNGTSKCDENGQIVYFHKCDSCGFRAWLNEVYPHQESEVVNG